MEQTNAEKSSYRPFALCSILAKEGVSLASGIKWRDSRDDVPPHEHLRSTSDIGLSLGPCLPPHKPSHHSAFQITGSKMDASVATRDAGLVGGFGEGGPAQRHIRSRRAGLDYGCACGL